MPFKKLRLRFLVLLPLALAACSTLTVDLPPVTTEAANDRLPGKIIWRDLLTNDPAASQSFYGALFGWEFEPVGLASGLGSDSAYTLIRHNGRLIGGMVDTVALNGRTDISQWIVLMSSPDIDTALERVANDGGTVIAGPRDFERRGRIAVATDATGAIFGMLETRNGDPADREPGVGEFLWEELWTTDVAEVTPFYEKVSGLDARAIGASESGLAESQYRLLSSGEQARFGIMASPIEGLPPVWVSYIRVEDPGSITARAAEYGGRTIVAAQSRPQGGKVAFVAGPSGAGIAVQTWPPGESD